MGLARRGDHYLAFSSQFDIFLWYKDTNLCLNVDLYFTALKLLLTYM